MNHHDSVEVLTRYIEHLQIKVSRDSIEKKIMLHPYCGSLLALTDVLSGWNIPNEAFFMKQEFVKQISQPFIARLTSNNGELVFVERFSKHSFIISNKHNADLIISVDEFKNIFSGEVLIMQADEQSGESDYNQKQLQVAPEMSISAEERLKPRFLIVGAQKSGTTSLYEYLKFHPDFRPGVTKEIHFFDSNYNKGTNWYHCQFPVKQSDNEFTCEASPCYLFHPLVPKRVADYLPSMKLIVLLRDPIERAYSHYQMNIAQAVEKLSFEQVIELENQRIKSEINKIKKLKNYNSFSHKKFSYLSRGKYADQIKQWLKFFDKKQILFIDSTDLNSDPQKVLDKICCFINITKFITPKMINVNSRAYVPIQEKTRIKLKGYFWQKNEELKKIVPIDFNRST